MNKEDLSNISVTYQIHYWKELESKTLEEVLIELESSKHIEYTKRLRSIYSNGEIENYTINKKQLPVVTFCAEFEGDRKKEAIKRYNRILILDIDKLGKEKLEKVIEVLTKDNYVFAFWKSPSNDGVKGLVHLEYEGCDYEIKDVEVIDSMHKSAFIKVKNYFLSTYSIELDQSGNDFTRLCFIAWDDSVIIKETSDCFMINKADIIITKKILKKKKYDSTIFIDKSIRSIMDHTLGKNKQENKKLMINIIKYLKYCNKSITYNYEEWLKVAFAIANSFTYQVGINYFLELSKLDNEKFNQIECENLLTDCFIKSNGSIKINTIVYFAKQKGFKINEKV